jgi:hypothetical protein
MFTTADGLLHNAKVLQTDLQPLFLQIFLDLSDAKDAIVKDGSC